MLPNRVALSQKATDKLRYMKQNTGLTPNILARIAIMLAIKEGSDLMNAGVGDGDGQVLSRDVLFGDYATVYDVMINQYICDYSIEGSIQEVISALIEVGVFKLGHVKKVQDLVD
jgi:DNA sulfur modification protein DndE